MESVRTVTQELTPDKQVMQKEQEEVNVYTFTQKLPQLSTLDLFMLQRYILLELQRRVRDLQNLAGYAN